MIAGIRLSINGLMKENDWVTVPKYNADGRVEDITLTSVKIRNWDKKCGHNTTICARERRLYQQAAYARPWSEADKKIVLCRHQFCQTPVA